MCNPVSTPGWNHWSGDKTRSDVDADDRAPNQTVGPDRDVSEGGGDGQVAVDADGSEAEDGGGAEEHVGEDPGNATRRGRGDQLETEVNMKREGVYLPAAGQRRA